MEVGGRPVAKPEGRASDPEVGKGTDAPHARRQVNAFDQPFMSPDPVSTPFGTA